MIKENEDLLDGFGGHKLAAGLTFSADRTPFETIKKSLNETIKKYTSGKDLKPFLKIDLLLETSDITIDLVEEISQLEPFGASNPSPIFALNSLKVKQKRLMGTDNSHLRLILEKDGHEFTAVRWGQGDTPLENGDEVDIAFHPQINEYNGISSIQLVTDDLHSEVLEKEEKTSSCKYKIYDNRNKTDIMTNVNDYLKSTKLKVGIFAESKYILDTIKQYPEICSKAFNRADIPKCDVIMFFDYPADRKTLDTILEKAQPKGLHFMNYEPKLFDEAELLKTFHGMVKFASHNNNGKIELVRCCSFLGKSIDVVERLLELFEETNMIKIKEKNSAFYIIEYMGGKDLSDIINSTKYLHIFDISEECEMFQQSLLEDDLEAILI